MLVTARSARCRRGDRQVTTVCRWMSDEIDHHNPCVDGVWTNPDPINRREIRDHAQCLRGG